MSSDTDALADRIVNIRGHEVYAYGQGHYDGDGCRTCAWQGPPGSGKAHEQETRREVVLELITQYLAERSEDLASSIEAIPVWDGYADGPAPASRVRAKAAELVRGTALI